MRKKSEIGGQKIKEAKFKSEIKEKKEVKLRTRWQKTDAE